MKQDIKHLLSVAVLISISYYPLTGNTADVVEEVKADLEGLYKQICSEMMSVEKEKESLTTVLDDIPEGLREWIKDKALHEIEAVIREDSEAEQEFVAISSTAYNLLLAYCGIQRDEQ